MTKSYSNFSFVNLPRGGGVLPYQEVEEVGGGGGELGPGI